MLINALFDFYLQEGGISNKPARIHVDDKELIRLW